MTGGSVDCSSGWDVPQCSKFEVVALAPSSRLSQDSKKPSFSECVRTEVNLPHKLESVVAIRKYFPSAGTVVA